MSDSNCEECFGGVIVPTCPPGPAGSQGPAGENGANGEQGPIGVQGPQGPQGDTGPQGPQGEPGTKGDTGATGAAGTNGSVGLPGSDGSNGINGSQIYFTDGAPSDGLGVDGDVAFDNSVDNIMEVYQNVEGTWESKGIIGALTPIVDYTADDLLFFASKTTSQPFIGDLVDGDKIFIDNNSVPPQFDPKDAWNGTQFHARIDGDGTYTFALEDLDIFNGDAGIDTNIKLDLYRMREGIETIIKTSLHTVVREETLNIPLFAQTGLTILKDDLLYVKLKWVLGGDKTLLKILPDVTFRNYQE